MKTITTEELDRLCAGHEHFMLVDVLPADEFDVTRIPGARNIPFEEPDFVQRVAELAESKDETVVVYCANEKCSLSTNAAKQLEKAGFTHVLDYKDGAEAWDAAQIIESEF